MQDQCNNSARIVQNPCIKTGFFDLNTYFGELFPILFDLKNSQSDLKTASPVGIFQLSRQKKEGAVELPPLFFSFEVDYSSLSSRLALTKAIAFSTDLKFPALTKSSAILRTALSGSSNRPSTFVRARCRQPSP